MVDLVHANEARRELKHVVAQGNDNELGVLGALLDVIGNDRDLERIVSDWRRNRVSHTSVILTFLKSKAASISSITYRGVGL